MDAFLAGPPATRDSRFVKPEAVSWRDIPGEIVVFDARSGAYHALNPSAAEIWRALSAGLSAGATIDRLAARFGVDRAGIERDVAEFITLALTEGLLLPDPGR